MVIINASKKSVSDVHKACSFLKGHNYFDFIASSARKSGDV